MRIQGTTGKDPGPKELKAKDLKITLPCTDVAEPLEQSKKEKIKKIKKCRLDHTGERKKTSTISDNSIDASKKDSRKKRYANKITHYNCNKKSHYASICIKSPKKIVLVLATSVLVTNDSEEIVVRILYIYYLVGFQG